MAVLTVIADVFGRAKPRGHIACPRRQAEPRAVLRCLARAKHRGLLLVHVGRSLATSCCCFFGCARSQAGLVCLARTTFSDCLDCLRPSERSDSAPPLFADRGSGVERSAKLASPARARAEQCRYLPRTFSWKRRLCEAWAAVLRRDSGVANFFSSAKRPSFLFMPDPRALKPLENLDGWITPKTFDEDGSSNVRARVAQAPPGMT